MASNYVHKSVYNVDMVFCIDVTGSMDPLLSTVKENAVSFYKDVVERAKSKGKFINQLRIRLLQFGDYLADGPNAITVTKFMQMPQELDTFVEQINSMVAEGGGDDPEDGLEALAYAIRSDWCQDGIKRRHIIVVWTDATTHPLGYAASAPYYPKKMAEDFSELTLWWEGENGSKIDRDARRLIMFAPDEGGWSDIANNWQKALLYPSEAGKGLEEQPYEIILSKIMETI